MGTNYYQLTDRCEHCKRCNRRHIGKSSFGWTFTFHAIPDDRIESYADWLRELEKQPDIEDEYGNPVTVEEFKQLVESKKSQEMNHTTYCMTNGHDREYAMRNCHLDDEGHSFSKGEFS
jgi:hypothetical protein